MFFSNDESTTSSTTKTKTKNSHDLVDLTTSGMKNPSPLHNDIVIIS